MSVCAARDCEARAMMFVVGGTVGLCYAHWRGLWTKTDFYDSSGWQGLPLDLKDGRRLTVQAERSAVKVERPPYGGLQVETGEEGGQAS